MRKSIDDALDDHPADDDERPPVSWAVALADDCDACGMGEPRVVLTVEEAGRAGLGLVGHLAPDDREADARRDRVRAEGDRRRPRPLTPETDPPIPDPTDRSCVAHRGTTPANDAKTDQGR